MRKKGLVVLVLTIVMSLASVFSSYAGEWKQDNVGWWYQNADSSYLSNGWYWINGKCYYFDNNGYCLQNTRTPDNYTVDASGAWIVNGVVQTRQTDLKLNTVNIQIPNGHYATVEEGVITLYETNTDEVAIIIGEEIDDSYAGYGEESYAALSEELVNEIVTDLSSYNSKLVSKGISTHVNRNWYYYNYIFSLSNGIDVATDYYISYSGNSCIMLLVYRTREILNGEDFINNYIR